MTNPLGALRALIMELPAGSPRSEVSRLEDRIRDGEDVSPNELAEARERVRISELREEGKRSRRRIADEAAAESLRAGARDTARGSMLPYVERVETARQALRDALRELNEAVDAHDSAVVATGELLIDAGLASFDGGLALGERWSGVDRAWHAAFEAGRYDRPAHVVLDGITHSLLVAGRVVLDELRAGLESIGDPAPENGERSALRRLTSL